MCYLVLFNILFAFLMLLIGLIEGLALLTQRGGVSHLS